MATKRKQIKEIGDLTPDPANVNKGSERGHFQLDWSLTELGAGRSILADADGVVLAGNKTLEVAADHGLPVRVIETDGKELVVVQRTDLRLGGKGDERTKARQLAIADNRVSETSYTVDVETLLAHSQTVDISALYRQDEIDQLITAAGGGGDQNNDGNDVSDVWRGMPEFNQPDKTGIQRIVVHFETRADVDDFARRLGQTITEKTRSMWHPYKAPENLQSYVIEGDGS